MIKYWNEIAGTKKSSDFARAHFADNIHCRFLDDRASRENALAWHGDGCRQCFFRLHYIIFHNQAAKTNPPDIGRVWPVRSGILTPAPGDPA